MPRFTITASSPGRAGGADVFLAATTATHSSPTPFPPVDMAPAASATAPNAGGTTRPASVGASPAALRRAEMTARRRKSMEASPVSGSGATVVPDWSPGASTKASSAGPDLAGSNSASVSRSSAGANSSTSRRLFEDEPAAPGSEDGDEEEKEAKAGKNGGENQRSGGDSSQSQTVIAADVPDECRPLSPEQVAADIRSAAARLGPKSQAAALAISHRFVLCRASSWAVRVTC